MLDPLTQIRIEIVESEERAVHDGDRARRPGRLTARRKRSERHTARNELGRCLPHDRNGPDQENCREGDERRFHPGILQPVAEQGAPAPRRMSSTICHRLIWHPSCVIPRQNWEASMKTLLALVLTIAAVPSVAAAGEIYGTIKEGGKPIKDGVKVSLVCGDKSIPGETDKNGSYRLFAAEDGKCNLTVKIGNEAPSTVVHSYANSARYNLILEKKDGKYALKAE